VDDVRVLLGVRIRDARKRLKLSQEELAHRARIHTTYLSSIETGKRNPALLNITRIAFALNLSLSELFSDFESKLDPSSKGRKRRKT